MRVCLFEDEAVADLNPLALTRPVFDLLCGQGSLARKQFDYFRAHDRGALVRPYLADLCRLRDPQLRVNNLPWLRCDLLVLVNGRWLPPPGATDPGSEPSLALVGDEIAYVVAGRRELALVSPGNVDGCLEEWKRTLPQRQAGGRLARHPWDLVNWNEQELSIDYERNRSRFSGSPPLPVALIGAPERLCIAPSARIEPLVVADTSRGPVVIDEEAVVAAFSRLEGPCYIGRGTQILGARVRGGTTLGPNCRIGGEIEATIIQGNTNKYHDGFLGHSYIGEWVNLGAGTQTSDLRNDYREVSVPVGGRPAASGLKKVGCFLGDHTKTGLGTLLNTGTSAGIFCNLLPGGRLLPNCFPSFTGWWMNGYAENADLDALLKTAAEVMRRRGEVLTDVHVDLFRHLFHELDPARRHFLQQARQIALRRSA
jgi:UDP-N-acetylglucosamine diphosphorylase/glucosamine-1-phosphate N-acetyltransferase